MIKTEFGYNQTLGIIANLEKAIEQTRKENPNKSLLNLILEGPLDELKKLKAEVRDYERRQHKH